MIPINLWKMWLKIFCQCGNNNVCVPGVNVCSLRQSPPGRDWLNGAGINNCISERNLHDGQGAREDDIYLMKGKYPH